MEIAEIKQRLSIITVLNHYGIHPDKNKRVNCPFHDDKTPSMQVYSETNTVFCFSGNCKMNGKAMDSIEFIQQKEGITKHQAIEKAKQLCTLSASEIPQGGKAIKKAESLLNGAAVTTKPALKPIIQTENLDDIFPKLKQSLYSSSKARTYAESRNIYNAKLEAGYNNGTHYKHLKNCIVFPLKDKQNNIVSFYGRNIESKGKDDKHFRRQRFHFRPISATLAA
jgi:DNA primase